MSQDFPPEAIETLRDQITRENALVLLRHVACPACRVIGAYQLFEEPANNAVGVQCDGCGKRHPLRLFGVMWLRNEGKRRSNDIGAVMKERGAYCYCCGTAFDDLKALGIGMHVHHARPFAEHGEDGPKIPTCALCHEGMSGLQRMMRRLVNTMLHLVNRRGEGVAS
jgi:hypothetical protein